MSPLLRSVVAAVAATTLLAVVGGCGKDAPAHEARPYEPGPLAGLDAKSAYIPPPEVGKTFTDGFAVIDLQGEEPATLLKVESLGGSPGLEYLGARIASPQRIYATQQSMAEWPPKVFDAETFEPENLTIEPTSKTYNTQGYEVLMGYRITGKGPAVRTGIRVTYRIGRTTYRAVLPSAIGICAPQVTEDACLKNAFELAGSNQERSATK